MIEQLREPRSTVWQSTQSCEEWRGGPTRLQLERSFRLLVVVLTSRLNPGRFTRRLNKGKQSLVQA